MADWGQQNICSALRWTVTFALATVHSRANICHKALNSSQQLYNINENVHEDFKMKEDMQEKKEILNIQWIVVAECILRQTNTKFVVWI